MEAEVREALRHLITAFENHLEAVASRRSPDDAAVDDAYEALAAAFERYEEKLDLEFAEGLPLVLDDVDDGDDDSDFEYDEGDDEDDDESDGVVVVDALGDDAEEDEIDDDLDEFNLRD
ncbi:MAG TPA: primosomal protein [Demequinaceae bacterium]